MLPVAVQIAFREPSLLQYLREDGVERNAFLPGFVMQGGIILTQLRC